MIISTEELTAQTAMARAKQMAIADASSDISEWHGWSGSRQCFLYAHHNGGEVLDAYLKPCVDDFRGGYAHTDIARTDIAYTDIAYSTKRLRRRERITLGDMAVTFASSSVHDDDAKVITITCIDPHNEKCRTHVLEKAIEAFGDGYGYMAVQVLFVTDGLLKVYVDEVDRLFGHSIHHLPFSIARRASGYYAGFKQVIEWGLK